MISLHPLRLRLRTNANVSTLFHSFYLIEYENNVVKIIRHRIPSNKYQLENIEAGLMGFLSDLKFNETTKETFGNFAITTSNGSLFNAFYRGSRERVFVGVSEYFFPSFARQILQDLTYVDKNSLYVTLLTLCEEPVLPMSHVSYSFQIGSLPRVIRFSSIDQINDINFSKLALSLLTPQMLVSAWESLMVEEKVLVVSNNTFLIQYICEFLRRIVLPLSIVTFSPYLPKEALPVIEAPFPYLVGGCSRNILDSQIDLSETVILDLDCRRVIHGSSGELTDTIAPPRMIRQLLNSLHQVMVAPLNELIGNPLPSSLSEGNNNVHDDYSSSNCQVIDKIINIFVTVNISLLTSRACGSTEVPTFFRRGSNISSYSSGANSPFQPTKHRPYLGFYRQTSSEINASGTMQLLRERYTDDENGSFVACWIEMDEMTFSVYEFIDDIPMAYFSIKNIRSISPLAIEPEGHVFEIILTNGKSYRFVATDPEARKGWVDFIEERMNVCKKQIGRVPIPGQSSNIGLNMNMNTSMSALRTSKTNYPSPSRSQHMSFSHADSFQDRDMILSSVKNTSMSYRENNRDRRDMNDSFARDNSNIHANSIRFLAQMANDTSMVAPDNVENDDDVRAPIIGYEDYLSTLNPSSSSNCILSQNEDTMLSQFRYKVNQTQMVRNFYSSIDCSDYESLFRQLGADAPLSAFAKDMFQDEVFPSFEQLLPTQASMSIIDFFSDLIETKTIPLNPTVDGSNSDDTAARSQLDNQSNSQMNTNRVDTPNQISSHSDSSILLQPEAFVLHVNAAYLESKKSKSRSVVSTTPDDTSDYSDKHVQIGGDVGVGDGGASTAQQFTFLSPIGEHPDESRLSMDSRPSPRPDLSDDLAACFTSSLKSISSESNKAIADALVLPVPLNDTIDASTTTNAVPIIASSVTESTSVSTPNSRSNSSDGGKWLNIKIHKVAISIDSISNEAQPPTIRSQEDTTIETHAEENIESVDAAINDPVGDEAVLDETTNDPSILPPLRISRRRHTIAVSKEATDHIPTAPEEIYTIKSKVAFDGEAEEPIPPALSPSTRPVKPVKPIKTASMRLSFNLDSDSISPSRTCSADSGDGMNILPPLNLSNPPSPIRSTAARSPQRRSKSVTEVSIRKESISKEFLPLTPTSVATKDSQKDTGLTSSTSKQRFSMKFGMSWTKGIYRKTDRDMVTDELKSKISPTDKTSPRPSKRLSAVDAKALVSSRKEEAKKILRRLIQHTAFANRKVEDELHKQIVQTRMSALTSVIKHHQKLSAPINAHTHNHSDSANSGLVLKTVINTTESSHKSESSQPTNLDYNKSDNWYDHIWSSLDPSSDRDCSNDDKEDEIINNIRSSIILRMQDLLGHSFTDPKTNDNKATTNAFDNNATSSEVPAEDCRAPLWQSMVGHCYDKLELDDKAIEYYAQSSFADVKEVMTLVAKKFLSVYPTLNLNDWKSNKSSVPLLSRAGIVFDRQDLLFLSSHNLLDPFLFGTAPNTMSNGSFVDSDTIDKSSRASNTSIFSPINESVQQYNTASDEPTNQKPILNISVFLKWAFSLGDLVGLQAYRLVTELIHQFLCHELATLLEVDVMCLQELDPSFQLGLHKSSSTFMNSGSLARLEAISVNNNANIGGTGNNVTSSSMRVPDSARQSLADINSSPSANTSQKQHSTTDGVLNSRIEYSELLSSLTPCELSTTLVIRVRELLRSSFIKTDRQSKVQVNDSLFTSVNVTTDLFSTLLSSSAFSEFEFETCKLQAVDLRNLSTNALTLFFCNIYNTLIVHGTIVYSVKGAPGSALYERNNFLKTFKYNIGGYLYSVLDIEHGVLRAKSAAPSIFGTFSVSPVTFYDRDPRRDFILKQPKPFITFFLFTANPLTTPLSVLRDINSLDEELEIYARQYIQRTVIFDQEKRQLLIPEIFRIYLKDFGESTEKMVLRILKLHTREFKEMLSTFKWKTSFYPFDWSPVLIF